jgi:hypothetical protein
MPSATDVWPVILNGRISPVLAACVPEQSSVEKPGTETTRTTGGYFSENRHMAPLSTALAYSRMSVATGVSCSSSSTRSVDD